jgi:hypothetical protein
MRDFSRQLDRLALTQFGLLSRSQATGLLGVSGLRRAVAQGQLVRIDRGVYRCVGVAPSFRQRALAACVACGPPIAVSHTSAAVLWTFDPVTSTSLIHVSVPPGRSARRTGVVAHRVRLPGEDVTPRFGVPVTSVCRTLLDLAGTMPESLVAHCIDDALRQGTASARQLLYQLDSPQRGPRRGQAELRRLLKARVGPGVPDSEGVAQLLRWVAAAGLPRPVCDHPLVVAGRRRCLDLAYPDYRIAIEFNGWEYHQMRSRMDDDHARTNELMLAGWIVLVVTAAHGEAETVDRIRRALGMRREGQGA